VAHEIQRGQSIRSETAVLVRVILPEHADIGEPLEELEGLATTAGVKVEGGMTQRRDRPDPATYMGSGKVEELKRLVEEHDADVVLFDNNLSPGQSRNLEKVLKVKVLDRTELILDIFASNARTYESRLAVELAQMEYSLPRLKRLWTHLSRIKMGVGMRGPGEKQLETDRRLVEKRIFELREELHGIERRKERQVAARRDHMTVSLVGYTNAGKSTLMNALTDADVLAADKLFATLDTRTRRWHLPSWGPVLLSDTVGFIRDLPHSLIASFKATLEEARQADLLLHIADASNPAALEQIAAVYTVLEEIGIQAKDTLLVLNKTDRPLAAERAASLMSRYPNAVPGDRGQRRAQPRVRRPGSGNACRQRQTARVLGAARRNLVAAIPGGPRDGALPHSAAFCRADPRRRHVCANAGRPARRASRERIPPARHRPDARHARRSQRAARTGRQRSGRQRSGRQRTGRQRTGDRCRCD
jgi:GTP-binding protein HflX